MVASPSISPSTSKGARFALVAMRSALLVALVGTAILYVDYHLAAAPAYCGAGTGCAKVRSSAYSHLFGISLPQFGLGFLGALFLLSCFVRDHLQKLLLGGFAGIAALGALGFIGLQAFEVGAFCTYCMVVDIAVIVAAVLGGYYCKIALREFDSYEPTKSRVAWVIAGLLFASVPLVWGPPDTPVSLPKGVAAYQTPGKVNIVMFTDFQCPFCRKIHPEIESIKKRFGDKVAVSRVMVPLEFHKGAEPAARAYLCAPDAKKNALADRLYAAPPEQLTRDGMIAFANAVGIDGAALDACMKTPAIDARLAQSKDLFRQAALQGLPSTFVENYLVSGADPDGLWRRVQVASSGGGGNQTLYMILFLVVAWLGAVFVTFRSWLQSSSPDPVKLPVS